MEIKTLEEYVVDKLMNLEDKVEELESINAVLTEKIKSLTEIYNRVRSDLQVRVTYDKRAHLVEFEGIWEEHEPSDYNWYVKNFALDVPPLPKREEDPEREEEGDQDE